MKRGLGWIPDLPDHRDRLLKAPRRKPKLPSSLDLRQAMPPVYDQYSLGSCTAQATAALVQYCALKQKGELINDATPSRLKIYYNARWLEGSTMYDSGAMIRDAVKSIGRWGVVDEVYWPYSLDRFQEQPPATVYRRARRELVKEYARVGQDLETLKTTLLTNGPIVFGFTMYDSFESEYVARTGMVPMPRAEEGVLGGHAVVLCGWHDGLKRFTVRNSWGEHWGYHGYCYFPYEYVTNPQLCDDFWNVALV